jgi:outer membrane protein assembly factor BamB
MRLTDRAILTAFVASLCAVAPGCGQVLATVLESAPDGGSSHGDAASDGAAGGDAATFTPTSNCGAGLQNGSPWPMRSFCQDHRARTPIVGAQTPTVKWMVPFPSDGGQLGGPAAQPAVAADGTIYYATGDVLYALNPDGTTKWSSPAYCGNRNLAIHPAGSVAIAADGTAWIGGDMVLAFSPDGAVRCLGPLPPTGSPLQNQRVNDPTIGSDGTVYADLSQDFPGAFPSTITIVVAMRPDGTQLWATMLSSENIAGTSPFCRPALGMDGTLYFATGDFLVRAIDPDGTPKWSVTCSSDGFSDFGLPELSVTSEGTLLFNFIKLFALHPDGTSAWTSGLLGISACATGVDGTLYFSSQPYSSPYVSSTLASIGAMGPDGTPTWTVAVTGALWLDTPVIGGDGMVYVGTSVGLVAVRPDGVQAWVLPQVTGLSPAIGADGTLYAPAGPALYAIGP